MPVTGKTVPIFNAPVGVAVAVVEGTGIGFVGEHDARVTISSAAAASAASVRVDDMAVLRILVKPTLPSIMPLTEKLDAGIARAR